MLKSGQLSYEQVVKNLPNEWGEASLRAKASYYHQSVKRKTIVLDDDPTGVQTVHDLDVLTQWDKPLLREAFLQSPPVFYILTNTRSFPAPVTERMNREIVRHVTEVAEELAYDFVFVSRSDSTLRGHYPLEVDVISDEVNRLTGRIYDGHLIIPAFIESGRYTYGDVHYLKEGDRLVPVNQTEFSKDPSFGYQHGHLCRWVEEKSHGRYGSGDCISISVEQLREGPDSVESLLLNVAGQVPVIVNAMSYQDLDVLSIALQRAEAKGKRFIYRTAASFVKSYGGISDRGYLTRDQMISKGSEAHGGVVIVGSHVRKTTKQLQHLVEGTSIHALEMDAAKIWNPLEQEIEVSRIREEMNRLIISGKDVVVYSSRNVLTGNTVEENLGISQKVSEILTGLVRDIQIPPKFILAKGGITSSDVATKGLGIRKAKILGQAAAGIPVWLTGEESIFPGMPYIVFPGNVGEETTLLEMVRLISGN